MKTAESPIPAAATPQRPFHLPDDFVTLSLTHPPSGDPIAMAKAISDALDRVPDRQALMRRGLDYTTERAAARFLEIVDELASTPPGAKRTIAMAGVSS